MASWQDRLGLRRSVAALAGGLFAFGFGSELWFRYLPAYIRVLGGSALAVGALGTLQDLLDAAYAYPGGWLSDRLGSRRALLAFAAITVMGFGVYLVWQSMAGVFVGLLLVMAWKSLGLPATFAVVGEELAGSGRIAGFTVQAVVRRLPIVIAPPLGGLAIERLGVSGGMRLGFAVSIGLGVVMLLCLRAAFRSRPDLPAPPPAELPVRGTRGPRLHPTLKRLLVADCLIRLCEGLPDVFLVLWAIEVLRVSPSRFGLLTSVLMGTSILSYVPAVALAERTEKKPFVVATFVFFTLFPLAVVLSRNFSQLLGAFIVGGLREVGEPARKALILDLSPRDTRGRAVGLYYAVRGFAVAGAAGIGGVLWTIRPSLTFYAATLLGAAGTLWAALWLPSTSEAV